MKRIIALLILVLAGIAWGADKKISDLPAASTPTGAAIPVEQGGITRQLPASAFVPRGATFTHISSAATGALSSITDSTSTTSSTTAASATAVKFAYDLAAGKLSPSGNAATATALAANGANCSAGSAPLGVNASGAAEGCFAVATPTDVSAKLSDAPSDGSAYARKDGAWSVVGSGTISSSTPTTFASGTVLASSGAQVRAATANDLNTILDTGATQLTVAGSGSYLPSMSTGTPTAGCATLDASGNLSSTGAACSTSTMVYPSTGLAFSGGSSWGTSYTVATSLGTPGSNTSIPTERAVRSAISTAVAGVGTGTLGGSTGSTDNAMLVASGTGGATVKASSNVVDTTGRITIPKAAGIADSLLLYSANGTDTTGAGIMGPSGAVGTSYYLQMPATAPAAGQILVTGTPASGTVNGATATVIPVTYMTLDAGRYTPTFSNASNISSGTPSVAHWTRNKNEVTVTGYVVATVTTTSGSNFSLSLPTASDLLIGADVVGVVSASPVAVTGTVQADTTNDVARFYISGNVSGSVTFGYSFTYTVQ